ILQTTIQISSSKPLSNSDSQLQVVKDPNARKSEECKFFDEPEIDELETRDYVSPEAGPGPQTQAHREGRLTESEEI
ncbi:11922_t:CDS:2, partial [Racocetra persica]